MNPNRCVLCSGEMKLVREPAEFRVGQRSARVEVERYKCQECSEPLYTPEQMDAAQRAAADEFRRQEGLLTPTEIKALRVKHNLTQIELERLIGSGPKTVVRWERGTVFQNRTADELMRVIDAVPAAFEHQARRHHIGEWASNDPIPAGPSQTFSYVRPDCRFERRYVAPMWKPLTRGAQKTSVAIEEEVALPWIPQEALQ